MADRNHKDHHKTYVQDYIRRYGAHKVEANALVVAPTAGRQLCEEAINRYLPASAPDDYERSLAPCRQDMRRRLVDLPAYLPKEVAP